MNSIYKNFSILLLSFITFQANATSFADNFAIQSIFDHIGKKNIMIEGVVDQNDPHSAKCHFSIFSNMKSHIAVNITEFQKSPKLVSVYKNDSNNGKICFHKNTIQISDDKWNAKITLRPVDGSDKFEVDHVQVKQSGILPSFHNYSCYPQVMEPMKESRNVDDSKRSILKEVSPKYEKPFDPKKGLLDQ